MTPIKGDGFIYGHGSIALFKIFDRNGRYRHSFYIDQQIQPLTEADVDSVIERSNPILNLETNIQYAENMPNNWPVWDNFVVSEDRKYWIYLNIDPPLDREWLIISKQGNLIGREKFKNIGGIKTITDSHVYTSNYIDGVWQMSRYVINYRKEKIK